MTDPLATIADQVAPVTPVPARPDDHGVLHGRTICAVYALQLDELTAFGLAPVETDTPEQAALRAAKAGAFLRLEAEIMAVGLRMADTKATQHARDWRGGGMLLQKCREFRRDNATWLMEYEQRERHHADKMRGYMQRTDAMANQPGPQAAAAVNVSVNVQPPETILDSPEDVAFYRRLRAKRRAESNGSV